MRGVWESYVGPFACLGLIGAWLTLEKLGGARSLDAVAVCLLVLTPITAGLLGALVAHLSARRGRRGRRVLAVCLPVLVAVAGMLNGLGVAVVLCVMEQGHIGEVVQMGVGMGAICGVMFIPAMMWTFLSARRVGDARRGSVLDAALRRAPWGAVAGSASIAVWAVGHRGQGAASAVTAVGVGVLVVGVVTLLAVLAADVRAFAVAARTARIAVSPVEATSAHAGDILDLGVGEELHAQRLAGEQTAYRDGGVRVTRLRGSVRVAMRKLAAIVAVDALATAVALGCAAHLAL